MNHAERTPQPPRTARGTPVGSALLACESGERTQMRLDPTRLALVGQQAVNRLGELVRSLVAGIRLEDPGLRLHHLAERPEAHAFAVRE